jgi:Metallo-peptidase family M12
VGRRLAALARISLGTILVLLVVDSLGSRAAAPRSRLFRQRSSPGDPIVVEWDRARVREAARGARRLAVLRFPLGSDLSVDLEIEPFEVTGPRTRFVLGRTGAQDEPIAFDPASVTLFRGSVPDVPGSHVFLSVSDRGAVGHVDLGPGGRRYGIAPLSADRASVFEMTGAASMQPGVPLCGVESLGVRSRGQVSPRDLTPRPDPSGAVGPTRGLKHLQLAVETDHEYYSLFGDTNAALTYLIQLYARVSDIYIRDVGTRVELVYARLWDTPDDLFNVVEPSPLAEFRDTWNTTMSSVTRDAAQLISGRRDYPFGGQAYLSALCSSSAYSVVGYVLGFFPDPSRPSVYAYDVSVAAHELGHNSGTPHTHDQGVDTCQNPTSHPQRGTIMSYCSQTWSGMNANEDEYFHAVSQQAMESHIGNVACVAEDCNVNSVPDASDISAQTSADENRNGIPDECEDCNGNGVLDSIELLLGVSDLNSNGVPDECEPDCNGNGVPDDTDIAGASTDLHGNGVPDECEEDCNANGNSDYSEIMAAMPLDVNRDAILDSCQDCDLDGIPDRVELDGAHAAWVASGRVTSELRAFHPDTGVLTRVSAASAGATTG